MQMPTFSTRYRTSSTEQSRISVAQCPAPGDGCSSCAWTAPVRRAFTLVEILIVVVILGILATIVVPKVSSASAQAKESALRDDVRFLRMQIIVYKAQHKDTAPGYPNGNSAQTPLATLFTEQMTMFTSESSATSPTASSTFRFGPYLPKLPVNPVNNRDTVLVIGNGVAMPAPTGTYGWIYKPETEEIYADLTGNDLGGVPFFNY
jgi:prepilin-type N-terminal cleavage/methylation domain-containing protein